MRLDRAGEDASAINWAKLVDDLHTGKVFGSAGVLLIDVTSGVIIALTLTGIYLWGVPMLRKRQSRRRQAAATAEAACLPPSDRLARLAAKKAEANRARDAQEVSA
jgi:hypothetical protein